MRSAFILFSLICCITWPRVGSAVQYFTVPAILRQFYPQAERIDIETKHLTDAQRASVKQIINKGDITPDWSVHVARKASKALGYVIVDNVLGREQNITYAVNIAPDGSVRGVEILVYREAYGGEIKNERFRKQFIGKNLKDEMPDQFGHDIQFVSGATISSRNVTFGVKRALAVWQQLYGK